MNAVTFCLQSFRWEQSKLTLHAHLSHTHTPYRFIVDVLGDWLGEEVGGNDARLQIILERLRVLVVC